MQHERCDYMEEKYITLTEAAELEGVKYKSLAQKISRDKESYVIKTEKAENGGKDRVLVAVSSLSKQARNAHKERLKLQKLSEAGEDNNLELNPEAVPWYINTDLDWYIENYKTAYYKAVELSNLIREFLKYSDKDRTLYAEEFAQKHLGKGQRTLYRYTKAYLEASAWADKKAKEVGGNYDFYKVLSLCRKPKAVGMFPSFTPECKQVIKNIWFNRDFAANQCTREMLYEKLKAVANINNWERIPSYQSVTRYITYLMEDENMKNAYYMAGNDLRDYKNKKMVKAKRDTKSLKVMEIVMGDEHTFDCWVLYKNPNGTVTPVRPKLVAWIDVRSRKIIGDIMCKDANSEILKQSLLKLIYHDAGSLPEYVYIDNGKDYTAETMTGVKRKERRNRDICFDDATKGFYKSIGIKDDHEALPYQPWSKAQIERVFRTVCDQFTKEFVSYTGTLTGSKTSAKINKDIKKLHEQEKLLTMEEFYIKWQNWLDKYHNKVHRGLKQSGEAWETPAEVFENAEKYEKAAPPKSYATMLMLKSDKVRVYTTGINRFGYDYRSDELCDYIGDTVNIKYDPQDMTTIYVFDNNGKKLCEAYSQELLQISGTVTETALEHMKMQKRQIKRDRKRLEEATKPIEEINSEVKGFNPVTGGIDLMVSGAGKKKAKVVSMPQDRTYTQNSSMRGLNDEEYVESEYMAKNAESALKKLRIINS